MPTINIIPTVMSDGTAITQYNDTVKGTQTFTFLTEQEAFTLKNKGTKDITYTVNAHTGTLVPSQSVSFTESITSFTLTTASGTQAFEVRADQAGTAGVSVVALDTKVNTLTTSLSPIKQVGNLHVLKLGHMLTDYLEPVVISLQGDSTGNADDEWFYLSMKWLASKYPKYTFFHRLWNDTKQSYDTRLSVPQSIIQLGEQGEAYASMPGQPGNYLYADYNSRMDIAGDIDIQAKIAPSVWANGAEQTILSRFAAASPNRSWRFFINASGNLVLNWSTDGGVTSLTSTSSSIVSASNGAILWVRATLDVDNGSGGYSVTFYTSQNGVSWTQLGSVITVSGVTSIYTSTTVKLEFGSRGAGTTALLIGKLYEAYVCNGINGKVVASPNLGMVPRTNVSQSFVDAESNTWTYQNFGGYSITVSGSLCVLLLNSSMPGANLAYSTDATRFGLQVPIEPVLSFISFSHNEGINISYQSAYEGLVNQLKTKYPNIGVVYVTQNPKKAPASYIMEHAIRNKQIVFACAKNRDGLVDAYRAFIASNQSDSLTQSDGVHPTSNGSILWKDEVVKFLNPALN